MVAIQRLIFCGLIALLSWLPASSYAVIAATSSTVWLYDGTTAAAACAARAAAIVPSAGTDWRTISVSSVGAPAGNGAVYCYFKETGTTINYGSAVMSPTTSTVLICPSNSSLSATSCTCSTGFVEDSGHTSCVSVAADNCQKVAGQTAGSYNSPYVPGASLGATFSNLCDPGSAITGGSACAVAVTYSFASQQGSTWVKQGSGTFTGSPCSPTSEAPAPQPAASSPSVAPTANPCPTGSTPGTLNGLQICSPTSDRNTVMAGPTSTASAPSGSASNPASGLGSNAPPTATSSNQQTACTGGSCTTTTTYTNSSGVVVGTASTSQPQTSFCAENPKASICGGPGSFSGVCGSPSACTGDAVMCAMAAATFKSECLAERGPLPDVVPVVNVDKSVSIIKNTGWGPETGICPAPRQMHLSFATIPLPLDILCEFAILIRPFIVGLAWLGAAFTFFGIGRKS